MTPVIVIYPNGEEKYCKTVVSASKLTGVSAATISNILLNKFPNIAHKQFRFRNPTTDEDLLRLKKSIALEPCPFEVRPIKRWATTVCTCGSAFEYNYDAAAQYLKETETDSDVLLIPCPSCGNLSKVVIRPPVNITNLNDFFHFRYEIINN